MVITETESETIYLTSLGPSIHPSPTRVSDSPLSHIINSIATNNMGCESECAESEPISSSSTHHPLFGRVWVVIPFSSAAEFVALLLVVLVSVTI